MEEVNERMRQERQQARRAECFSRLMLRNRKDADGRSLLDHAERTAERLAMQWEKEIAWLAAALALEADGVDETTLTGLGFNDTEVRHATIVRPRDDETAADYAERIAAYNQPETFEVAAAMLADPASKNPAVPQSTTDGERRQAIERLQQGMRDWSNDGGPGARPPAGGTADNRPTAPGLAAAIHRLDHHTRMGMQSLREMLRGPGNAAWGIIERLSPDDLEKFVAIGWDTLQLAAAIVIETSTVTPKPATKEERDTISAADRPGDNQLKAIAITAATISRIAVRMSELEAEETGKVH